MDALGASLVVLVGEFVFCAGEPRDFLLGVSSSLDPSGVLVGLARARLAGPFGSADPFCFAGGVASAPRDFLHVFLFRAARRALFTLHFCDMSSAKSFANSLIVGVFFGGCDAAVESASDSVFESSASGSSLTGGFSSISKSLS